MADLSAIYTLTTPGGVIIFNDGELRDGQDKYWLSNIQGLDGSNIRAPIDNVPFGDGGIVHDFWKGPRHVLIEGTFVHESVGFPGSGNACRQKRNEMEETLRAALESILRDDGTLAWTPLGLAARSLTVRHDVTFEAPETENYTLKTFTFGLVAADPEF